MTRSSDTSDARAKPRLRRRPLGRYRYVRLRWRVLFAVIDCIGTAVFAVAKRIRRWVAGGEAARHEPKVILLVQLDHLGDAVLTTAVLPVLRKRYPNATIEVLAGAWNREVFQAAPEVDRVHVSRVNRFARSRLARLAWIPATLWWGLKLRRRKIDLAIDVRGEFPLALITWLCGARRRLGWASGGGGFLLTDSPRFVPGRPEIDSRLALLAELGIRPSHGRRPRPRFHLTDQARRRVARKFQIENCKLKIANSGPLVVLHVGAGTRAKQWAIEHWRELLGRIIVGHGAQVILIGSRRDRMTARAILGGRPWPGVVDFTGRLSVVELAALLEQSDVLVGVDSGPAHLAAAVETPAVVLFSGTNSPQQWQPCGRQVRVLRHEVDCSPCHGKRCRWSDHPCMEQLRPERVAAAVGQILSNARRIAGAQHVADIRHVHPPCIHGGLNVKGVRP